MQRDLGNGHRLDDGHGSDEPTGRYMERWNET